VTVEEALIGLLAAVAGILLLIGLAQALDSRPPRRIREYLRMQQQGIPDAEPREPGLVSSSAGLATTRGVPGLLPGEAVPSRRAVDRPPREPGPDLARAASARSDGRAVPGGLGPLAQGEIPDTKPAGEASSSRALVDMCLALFQMGRHAELVRAVLTGLARDGGREVGGSHSVAALWTVAALSRRALGEDAEARAALGAALAALPTAVVDGAPPQVAAMAVPLARRLIELAEQSPEGVEERIAAPRLAAFWLRSRLAAAPGDPGALALLGSVREALSEGYAESVTASLQRREWTEAVHLIHEAREQKELSAARAQVLLEVVTASLREEVHRVTSPAFRGAQYEDRAVTGLERAQAILRSMNGAALPPRHWAAMSRRIWRGYARLGQRRLRAGSFDDAADALFRALAMVEIGRRRQRQVREILVSTLEDMCERRAATIPKLLAEGARTAATAEARALSAAVERAQSAGVPPEQLRAVTARAVQLVQLIDRSGTLVGPGA